jgi:hypothetical protein
MQYHRIGKAVTVRGQRRDEAAAEADAKRAFEETSDIEWV